MTSLVSRANDDFQGVEKESKYRDVTYVCVCVGQCLDTHLTACKSDT